MDPIPFDTYVSSLSRLSTWSDPTHATAQSAQIAAAVASLEELPLIDRDSLSQWIHTHPNDAGVLALIVGLSKEKLKNQVRHWFGVGSPSKVAREKPRELVDFFDEDFDLIRLVNSQLRRTYTFADILNARATTRHSAVQAGESGPANTVALAIHRGTHFAPWRNPLPPVIAPVTLLSTHPPHRKPAHPLRHTLPLAEAASSASLQG